MSLIKQLSLLSLQYDQKQSAEYRRVSHSKNGSISPKQLIFNDMNRNSQTTSLYQTPKTDLFVDDIEVHNNSFNKMQYENKLMLKQKSDVQLQDILFSDKKFQSEIASCKLQIEQIDTKNVDINIKIQLIKGIKEKLENIIQEYKNITNSSPYRQQTLKTKEQREVTLNLQKKKGQKTKRNSIIHHNSFHSDRIDNYSFSNILYTKKTSTPYEQQSFIINSGMTDKSGFKFAFNEGPLTCFNSNGFRQSTINDLIQDFLKFRKNYNQSKFKNSYYASIKLFSYCNIARLINYDNFEQMEIYQMKVSKKNQTKFTCVTPFSYDQIEDSLYCDEDIFESPQTSFHYKYKETKLDKYRYFIIQFHNDILGIKNIFSQLQSIQSLISQQIIIIQNENSQGQISLQDLFYEDNQRQSYLLQLQIIQQQIQEKEMIKRYIKKQRQVSFMDLTESPKGEQNQRKQTFYHQPSETTMASQSSYQQSYSQSARMHHKERSLKSNIQVNPFYNESFSISSYQTQGSQTYMKSTYDNKNTSFVNNDYKNNINYHKQLKSKSKSDTINLFRNQFGSEPYRNKQSQNFKNQPIVSQFNNGIKF